MLVMVSGPVSAESDKKRMEKTAKLNRVAAEVLKRGHIPLVDVNAAVPVVEAGVADKYEAAIFSHRFTQISFTDLIRNKSV
jgi:hypothetical protein